MNNFSHAYLISGERAKCEGAAQDIIKKLKIQPQDIFTIQAEDSIKIQEIRNLIHYINLKPHSSEYKSAIITEAEKLTLQAANALLKTLEEPPPHSIIFLLTKSYRLLIPTIISRCRKIELKNSFKVEVLSSERDLFDRVRKMTIKEKFDLAKKIVENDELKISFDRWLNILREDIRSEHNRNVIRKILWAKKNLDSNVNKRLLLENVLLEI